MRANEYQTRAMSTRLPSCENATYMLFGLMAEIGEIADKIAKWRRKGVCRLDMDHQLSQRSDFGSLQLQSGQTSCTHPGSVGVYRDRGL